MMYTGTCVVYEKTVMYTLKMCCIRKTDVYVEKVIYTGNEMHTDKMCCIRKDCDVYVKNVLCTENMCFIREQCDIYGNCDIYRKP